MSEARTIASGRLCGAARFAAAPTDRNVGSRHCGMCRKWTAGPFLALDRGTTLKLDDAVPLGTYRSSAWAERSFRKKCGTPFIDEKPAYDAFANNTHNMTGVEVFAAFAPPAHSQGER